MTDTLDPRSWLYPTPRGLYYLLASVGIFSLLVGAAVRVRRPDHQATLHFFWLAVAFFGTLAFSFTGKLDTLDWIFYWGDLSAQLLLPALLFTPPFGRHHDYGDGPGKGDR